MSLNLIRFIEDDEGTEEEKRAATEMLLRRCEATAPDSAGARDFFNALLKLLHANGYIWNGTTLRAGNVDPISN